MEKTEEDRGGKKDQRTTSQANWTFLVYMAGDNNLEGAALRDIAEMAKVGSTKDVHILVPLDRLEDQKTRRFLITQGGGFKKDCWRRRGRAKSSGVDQSIDYALAVVGEHGHRK